MTTFRCATLLLLALPLLPGSRPQDPEKATGASDPIPAETRDADALITALYDTVSFDKGGEPDWQRLRSFCLPGASFVQPVRRGERAVAITTEQFIDLFKGDLHTQSLKERGFHERVASRVQTDFGELVHCWVVFEIRFDPKAAEPVARGVDSIQLVRDGGRYWIASITTDFERPGKPLPAWLRGDDKR